MLALNTGCGKPENAAPTSSEADPAMRAAKAEPTPTPEKVAIQPTNAAATEPKPDTIHPATDQTPGVGGQAAATLASLSQDQMVQGLKDALAKGLQQAIARLGNEGGFLTNLNVKIPMPEQMRKVESALRAMNQDKLADDFVATMNHAAEQAVPEAAGVFADTLRQMTIEDAKSILSGPDDAATRYFQRTTQTNLYAKFYPIVQKATEKTGVTAAYKNLMAKANVAQGLGSIGGALGSSLLGKDSLDLDDYVTRKAMDGLFKMVAEEEKQIRQNPVARTTDMLQKVFGALKQ
ncbi:MAG: DUF4197 family protein [Verrucomicrobia bacterium]|nr:DUF4197 family protein [Verrucomicrobiota bacterium]